MMALKREIKISAQKVNSSLEQEDSPESYRKGMLVNEVMVFATSIDSRQVDVSNIPITKQEVFPLAVEQILMNRIAITIEENVSKSIINDVLESYSVKTEKTSLDIEETSLTKIDVNGTNRSTLFNSDEIYCTKDYIYTCNYEENILTQFLYFPDGDIRKCVSYKYNDIIYAVINNNNTSLEKSASVGCIFEESLSDEEINTFFDLLEKGEIAVQDSYSIEDVRELVGNVNSRLLPNDVAMYANTDCPTMTAYAPGGNYTLYNHTKPVSAQYTGTYCTYISGLSQYNNGSNTAQIREYNTRKSYVESYNRKNLFAYGTDVMLIVSFCQLAITKTFSALSAAGVVIDIAARITSPTVFYAEQQYTLSAYRESQIYDHTEENAYVELPQLYSQMVIGITYGDQDDEGYYIDASWQVITKPKFSIPSIGNPDSTPQQYCDYVADIYYRNCIINGRWVHGRTAYGGLGG